MPRMPLVHPEMKNMMPEQYPDLCTIQAKVEIEDEYGQPKEEWVDYYPDWKDEVSDPDAKLRADEPTVDHRELDALLASTGGRKIKEEDKTYTIAEYHISLKGYYPEIEENMRAVIDNTNYNILLTEETSRDNRTRLAVEVVQ